MTQKPEIQDLTNFIIDYTSAMIAAGTYTSRVARCASRIAKAYGYELNLNFFFHHTSINIFDIENKANIRTYIIPNKYSAINFSLISDLSALSWNIFDHSYKLEIAREYFEKLLHKKRYHFISSLFLSSLANAAFCRLFEGDIWAMIFVFFATFVGINLRYFFTKIQIDLRIQYIICSFLSSLLVAFALDLNLTQTPEAALGSSILYLIPGVFFINSVIDILKDHILMGLSRFISVAILITCIGAGIYITLSISKFGILQ
ncbi:threonine/serine exporter ThrE family protein [Campylobacter sp. US33a]|uniref:threonine/serine ThrE exporter family protein n=1 Tax=Campylobacter sp. US33a TaxID=2498120 RepID=UPI0010686C8D|nr:threonine/serine exporter family protein [Campylobacter sp. US33a]TEY02376.1 threonine/serine exporter [Campylobacter sp. US33a]